MIAQSARPLRRSRGHILRPIVERKDRIGAVFGSPLKEGGVKNPPRNDPAQGHRAVAAIRIGGWSGQARLARLAEWSRRSDGGAAKRYPSPLPASYGHFRFADVNRLLLMQRDPRRLR